MATKDFSTKQERSISKFLSWRTVVGSGARDFHPGDIISDDWLGECKTHTTIVPRIVFYRNFWDKIVDEANSINRYPALFVDNGSQKINDTWVMFNPAIIRPDDSQIVPNIVNSKDINISFNNDNMKVQYQKLKEASDKFIILSAKFNFCNINVGVVPLIDFRDMFC